MKKKRKKAVLIPAQAPPAHPGKELLLREALLNDPLPRDEFDFANPVEKMLSALEQRRIAGDSQLPADEVLRQLWGVVARNERHIAELERRLKNFI